MQGLRFAFIFTFVTLLFFACSPKNSEIVVATFDDKSISFDELQSAYETNKIGTTNTGSGSIDEYKEFTDLYLNYKMKLAEAEERGYKNDPAVKEELLEYRRTVGVPYFVEKHLIEPALKEMYENRKEEIRVSHILIRFEKISPEEAKSKADTVLMRLKAGEKFEDLAAEYSEDIYSKDQGGDIYYVTAGQVLPEFERAAYKMKVGEVYPEPVKTKYGYHILKVTERQKRIPKIRASHILVQFKNDSGNVDTAYAFEKILKVKARLDAGEDFAEVAKETSDDRGTKEKGGDLGFFQRRMMVRPFDEAAFKLEVGQMSDIVESPYGYHIIKLTEKERYPSYEDDKSELRKFYERAGFEYDFNNLIDSLKSKYNYKQYDDIRQVVGRSDGQTTFGEKYWESELRDSLKNLYVCQILGNDIPSDSLFKFAETNKSFKGYGINGNKISEAIRQFTDECLIHEEVKAISNSDPEFMRMMEDYENGIYIFRLQDEEVWQKIEVDSTQLIKLWEETKENYRLPDRVTFAELFSIKKTKLDQWADTLKSIDDFEKFVAENTERRKKNVVDGIYTLVDANSSIMAQKADSMEVGQISELFESTAGWSIVKTLGKEEARQKTYEEALPEVASLYQDRESKRLEKEFLQYLKDKYNPKPNYELLQEAIESGKM